MQLFYAFLTFVMAFNNLMKALNTGNPMNYAMAALWLVIGIVFSVKYLKEKKARNKNHKHNEEV